ncbi:MAG: hypothetical protein JXB05_28985 [Myxococcaceae bacterium]|nr:hypothetical protein [Myxococcaceae bacterium]
MSHRDLWKNLYERFDPERPAEARWRADRPQSPAERIVELLGMPFGDPRILLMGTVGTGKSTELLRVKEAREKEDLVVFIDLARHFSEVVRDSAALDRVSPWEVCFLAGVALVGTLKSKLNYEFPPEDIEELKEAWSAIAKATDTPTAQLDIGALAKSMMTLVATAVPALVEGSTGAGVATGFAFTGAAAGAIKLPWTLPVGRSQKSLPDQDTNVQRLLGCVNTLIGHIQSSHRRVLFVIDGLDRIRDIAHAKRLFVDSHLIAQLACRVVICAPFALRHHLSTATARGFEPLVLANEPVLRHDDPTQPGKGVRFFCELFERRVADLGAPELISKELLEKLAYYSGGRARDFVRFIRELAQDAWLADVSSATEELVQTVLDRQRRTLENGLHQGHIQLLGEIAGSPEHHLPDNPLFEDLLNYHRLLPYPNESEWYYPHPLLMIHMVRVKRPGSSG